MASTKKTASNRPLDLPSVLGIAQADTLLKEIKSHIKKGNEKLEIKAEEVSRITTPCVQILLSANNTLIEGKGRLMLTNPSEAMHKVFTDLGLEKQLEDWRADNG